MFENIQNKEELKSIADIIVTSIDETDSIQSLKDRLSQNGLYNPSTQMLAESIGNLEYNPFENNSSLSQFRKDILKAEGIYDPEVKSLKEEITIKDAELDVFSIQIQGLKKKLSDLTDDYDRVVNEKDEYKKDLDVAHENYDKLQIESERVLSALKETTAKQVEEYKEKIQAQSIELKNLTEEVKSLQSLVNEYKEADNKNAQNLISIKGELEKTKAELAEAEKNGNAWYQAYQQLEAGQSDIVTRYLYEQFSIDLNSGVPLLDQMKTYIAKADNMLA